MTKITGFVCDMCGKEFRSTSDGGYANYNIEIKIPSVNMFTIDTKYEFKDVCSTCMNKFTELIESLKTNKIEI